MNGGSLNSAAPKVISIPSQPVLIGFQEEFCQMREPPTLAREPAPSCRIPVIVACRRPACRKETSAPGTVGSEDVRNLLAADKRRGTPIQRLLSSIRVHRRLPAAIILFFTLPAAT